MQVGFLGVGAMGAAMARNVVHAGHTVRIWNRTRAKAEALVQDGATVVESEADLAETDAIIAMLADDAAFAASTYGSGLFDALGPQTTFVNMATISVACARDAVARFRERGLTYVAAPVLGRPEAAAAGQLNVLAAGASSAVARVQPLFDAVGQKTWHVGEDAAAANVVKIAANFMIASAIETMGEAFALARGNGVEPATVLDVVANTILEAPVYKNYGAQIVERRFDPPGFRLVLGLKDVGLALAAGEQAHTPLPFASVLRDTLLEAIAAGDGERDWSSLAQVVQRRAGERELTAATKGGTNA